MTGILKKICGLFMGVLLYIFTFPIFAASYTYYIVQMPIEFDSSATAINNSNNIVGSHQSIFNVSSGWLYQNGVVNALSPTGNCLTKAIEIVPMGINDNNIIVGQKNACGTLTGFTLENGFYQDISFAIAGATRINDINNSGMMVGSYTNNIQTPIYFSYNGLSFTQLVHRATAINDDNFIVGDDYIHDSMAYQVTKVIKPGAQRIELTGINNVGQTIGVQFNQNDTVRKSFVYDSTGFSIINYPGSLWTIANGINDQGVITGWVSLAQNYNGNGVYTGGNFSFIAIPNVTPDPNAMLPLPMDKTSPSIAFGSPLNVEFSAQELGATLTGDFDQDGSDDLIIAHTMSRKLTLYFGQSAGRDMFNDSVEIGRNGFNSIGYVSSVKKADFDGDGILDLAIGSRHCNNDNRKFMVLRGTGSGKFINGSCLKITTHVGNHDSYVYDIAVADFNGDTLLDIAVSRNGNYGGNQVLVYLGYGDMTFSAATVVFDSGLSNKRPYKLRAKDQDADGNIDLLVEFSKYSIQSKRIFYMGDGTGQFQYTKVFSNVWPKSYSDMNNDSYPDNLVSVDAKTLIYFGNSSGGFNSTPQILKIPSASRNGELSKVIADFNGNGRNDILVFNRNMGENVLGKVYKQTMATGTATGIVVPVQKPVTVPPVTKPKPVTPGFNTGAKMEFKGIITAVNVNSILVNGIQVNYSTSTLVIFEDGTGNTFTAGQFVNIQAIKNTNGAVNAFEIAVKP